MKTSRMCAAAFTAAALTVAAAIAGSTLPQAAAKDAPSYPEGVSRQKLDDHAFELVVPAAADAKPPYSLLVVIADAGTVAEQFVPLAKDGWVVLMPKHRFAGDMWATSETKDVHDDVDAVAAAFAIAKDRMHCLAIHDRWGFANFVAYDKRGSFASVSYATSEWSGATRGKSPPGDARKRVGVLLMGEGALPAKFDDPEKIAAGLEDKVRTVEYRRDADPFKPYFRYWLGVMDGRFEPGYDLSFDWIADAAAPVPEAAAKAAPPSTTSALAVAKAKGAAAFVYFWSAEDAAKPEAKALQNEVFFDADVRDAGRRLVAVKLDRARYEEAFAGFGLKTTPAVVVVDGAFDAVASFQGPIASKALAKALAKAASTKRK